MLGIPDLAHQLEVVEDIAYKRILLNENIGFKYQTMIRLLKRDWKIVKIAKQIMMNLIGRIQLIMTILKKNPSNRSKILLDIKKYWKQALYN